MLLCLLLAGCSGDDDDDAVADDADAPAVFVGSTPAGAHNSGPGDDECDGVGTDDLFECD